MHNLGGGVKHGKKNYDQERVWFSPHCVVDGPLEGTTQTALLLEE
jgi:hypothetical protein